MSEEVLINVTPRETRVAMVENGVLQEVVIERTSNRGLVGNIYKGRVCRVLPGMQAAFVEIGLERAAFLHASDIVNTHLHHGDEQANQPESIEKLLHGGQALLVQVIKEPLGTKGARLTTKISIPSRYVVFLPTQNMIGISTRIESAEERQRLKDIALQHTGMAEHPLIETPGNDETLVTQPVSPPAQCNNYGFIIRTAAEGAKENLLCADMDFLCQLWKDIKEKEAKAKPCSLIYKDLPLVLRTVRYLIGSKVDKIKIDSRDTFREVVNFAKKFIADLVPLMEHYSGELPLFDFYAIDDEITKALERKVPLKSGGYLVIDQTEAMTTIDVNTGAYVGSRNLEETLFKTNLEAAQAIARQLRLRNLGGIIILDFIDMEEPEHKRQILRTLEKSLEQDHTKSYISEISSLGLVQMTRKRTRESLEHVLCETCRTCGGRGSIKTAETVCYEIFREILRFARQFETQRFLVLASQEVVDMMLDEESHSVLELEDSIDCSIRFQVETSYSQEQYDIIPVFSDQQESKL
ncbi:MAG TPA: Rne/Rng family ribonuclease [Thioploca sp.]|nr:Rne/Rng family ribonuclease [Thioploca sp.]